MVGRWEVVGCDGGVGAEEGTLGSDCEIAGGTVELCGPVPGDGERLMSKRTKKCDMLWWKLLHY